MRETMLSAVHLSNHRGPSDITLEVDGTMRVVWASIATPGETTARVTLADPSHVELVSETDQYYAQILEEEFDWKGRNKRSIGPRS